MSILGGLRRVAMLRPVRAVLTHPRVEPLVVRALPATAVRELPRFLRHELGGRRGRGAYRLRGTELELVLRHGTPDVAVLGEVFYERIYEPPAGVAGALAGAASLRVLDLGANIGLFGLWVRSRWPDALITAFEPDPANLELLRQNAGRNGGDVEIVEAAASTRDGTISFGVGEYSGSRVGAAGARTIDVRAVDVLPLLGRTDYAKIDIEGSEWPILGDPRFAETSARVIALEYHPYLCPEPDPRAAARARLESAGFAVADGRRFTADHGMLWAWRG